MPSSAPSTMSAPEVETPSVELRASVLDAAISLGFRNSVMKRWMFEGVEGDDYESVRLCSLACTSHFNLYLLSVVFPFIFTSFVPGPFSLLTSVVGMALRPFLI